MWKINHVPICSLLYTENMTTWELQRNWDIVRYIVYYLVEDLISPGQVTGGDVVDFSSGLGDLSEYIYSHNPNSLIATSPDDAPPPSNLEGKSGLTFIPDLSADQISGALEPNSVDLFVARMVFQFPTDEDDRIDVDGMLAQIFKVLRPGGQLVICSHEFTQLNDDPESWDLPLKDYLGKLQETYSGHEAARIQGLIELIEAINELGVEIAAVDIPSGLDCDLGIGLPTAIKAAVTITFVALKKGFTAPTAGQYTSEIYITSIGIQAPEQLQGDTGGGT